jgi:fibronectin-binding autotransporter adhesin
VNNGTLLVNGNQSAATGIVTVNAGGTLAGTGVVGGATTVSGSLAPGISGIGTLSFGGDLTFMPGGKAVFELSRTPLANDQSIVGGTLTYGGTLQAVNVEAELLEAGDVFQLFSATVFNGSFADYDLPALEDGLDWETSQLAVDGSLWVVSTNPPVINALSKVGGQLIVTGIGGTPNWDYFVLSSTNLTLPRPQWERITTNQFNSTGGFSFSVTADSSKPGAFYLLQAR